MKKSQSAALVEAFALAYHAQRQFAPVCEDAAARRLFTDEEFAQLGSAVTVLLQTLEPSFSGTPEAALLRVVDRYLVPLPAARDAFLMRALKNAARIGAAQALFLGAGYSTIPLRQTEPMRRMCFYELESPSLLRDKRERLRRADIPEPENTRYQGAELRAPDWARRFLRESGFDPRRRTFCALPGLAASCPRKAFWQRLMQLLELRDLASVLAAASGAACARQHGCAGLPRRRRNLYGGGNGENAPASGVSRLRASRSRRHYRPVLRRIQRHAPLCAHGGTRRCVFLRGGQESRSMIFPAAWMSKRVACVSGIWSGP